MNALSHSELEAREWLVDEAPTDNFAELVRIAGLDPKKHLRFADWSGVNFKGSDLRGFDFTGARLIRCKFKGALIEGARFDQALIDVARPGAKLNPGRTNLRASKEWKRCIKTWKPVDKLAPDYLPPGAVFQDAPFAPEMVVVPPGRFWMGDDEGHKSECPRHEVTIPQAFAVGRCPVTFTEWDAAYTAGGVKHKPSDRGEGRGPRPVIDVSSEDVQTYVAWLSEKTGMRYRLPSEAEWEYACRAGTETAYSFGDAITKDQARFSEGTLGNAGSAVSVGSFPANGFGLNDMHGNVWEWCEDCWNEDYADKPETLKQTGGVWTTGVGNSRVLRGGSWYFLPRYLRSAFRHRADSRNVTFGFRVARTLLTT